MNSVQKSLNVVNNFYTFLQFNPTYSFRADDDLIVYLLVLKEAWQSLYEELMQAAMKNRASTMESLIDKVTIRKEEQRQYLEDFLIHPFPDVVLCDELLKYNALA